MGSNWPRSEAITGVIGTATGFVLGFFTQKLLRRFFPPAFDPGFDDEYEEGDEGFQAAASSMFEDHKLVLCVRTDLKMQKGKIAAQVGHATLGAYKEAMRYNGPALKHWERNAQPKIALQISSRAEAKRLEAEAKRRGLITFMVHDAGRTQIAAGSMTVLAVGPGPVSLVNQVTGSLKLL